MVRYPLFCTEVILLCLTTTSTTTTLEQGLAARKALMSDAVLFLCFSKLSSSHTFSSPFLIHTVLPSSFVIETQRTHTQTHKQHTHITHKSAAGATRNCTSGPCSQTNTSSPCSQASAGVQPSIGLLCVTPLCDPSLTPLCDTSMRPLLCDPSM